MKKMSSVVALAGVFAWSAGPVFAQDGAVSDPGTGQKAAPEASEAAASLAGTPEGGWAFSVTPYLWIPAQDGNITVAGTPTTVDLGVGDTFDAITDNFNFAALLHFEAERDRLTLFVDAMYLSLEDDSVAFPSDTGSVRQDQGVFELGAAYTIADLSRNDSRPGIVLEPLAGVRMQYLDLEIDPSLSTAVSRDRFWADAFAGARARVELIETLALRLRADAGGGMSDFTWSALAGLDVALTHRASLILGYRTLTTDFDDGNGPGAFVYDMTLDGPFVALTVSF